MNAFNDSLTIGLIFFLIISAISIYFYTRLQEFENKIEMTEGMLFDIKSTLEFMHYVSSIENSKDIASASASPSGPSGFPSGSPPGSPSASHLSDRGVEHVEHVESEELPLTSPLTSPLIPLLVPFAEDDDKSVKSVKSELSVSSSTGKPQPDINDLLSLKLNDLRKLARTKNITNYMKLTKKELVEQLSSKNKNAEEELVSKPSSEEHIIEAE